MFNMERDVWKFALLIVILGFVGVWFYDAYAQAYNASYYSDSRNSIAPHTLLEQIKYL